MPITNKSNLSIKIDLGGLFPFSLVKAKRLYSIRIIEFCEFTSPFPHLIGISEIA